MKKVLHITGALHRSGTETFIMNVFKHLDRSEIMFDFLLYEPHADGYEQEAKDLGARIYYYSPRRKGLRQYKKSLKDFFKKHAEEYQAVHYSGNSFSESYPVKLAKDFGIPVRIMHSHNSTTVGLHNKILHKWNRSNLHKIATDFLACSESARVWGYGNSKSFEKSIVVPNGIELDSYRYNPEYREEIRNQLCISSDSFVICHTGTFRTVKNHPFIVEVFREIKNRRKDAILLLCGAGGNEKEIREMVSRLGLDESVRFVGMRTDINKLLSASDAYLFPSLYEGLPFALIEAQASGIPIFCSDTISKEIKLTDKIELLPLSIPASDWAERILNYDYSGRTSGESESLSQYDIKTTCKILTHIYSKTPYNEKSING